MKYIVTLALFALCACEPPPDAPKPPAPPGRYMLYDQQLEVGMSMCAQLDRCNNIKRVDIIACAEMYAHSVCEQAYVDPHGIPRVTFKCTQDVDPMDAKVKACTDALDTPGCGSIPQGICEGVLH